MVSKLASEYLELLKQQLAIEQALLELPKGYISRKNINGKLYCYLQSRKGDAINSRYLKGEEVQQVIGEIALRKEYESKLPAVLERLSTLEKSARLLDEGLFRRLMTLKLSNGMDTISQQQKQSCISFSDAMTSIEGIAVSDMTRRDLEAWESGKISFLTIYENTLRRYGFPVEV